GLEESILIIIKILLFKPHPSGRAVFYKTDCHSSSGSCFPITCPWPFANHIGECIWPILRCCLQQKEMK
uniref:Beta-defensin-like domain-containing protein n=1 Tax=Podarcis muralis TaxID=64176 RepID=A0A670HN73_PODMU